MSELNNQRALIIGAATCLFGVSTLLRKFSMQSLHPFQFQIVAAAVYVVQLVPMFYFSSSAERWDVKGITFATLCSIVVTIANILFMFALRSGHDTAVISSLSSASPIITAMLAFLFLGEQPDLRQAIGIFFVLIGVVIVSGR